MIKVGSLVRSQTNSLGIGKVVEISSTHATVEYFSSVGQRIPQSLTLNSITQVQLYPQTRCFIWSKSHETWTIGRIYNWDEEVCRYQIDLPDSKTILAAEEDIYVRCNKAIDDPIEMLVMKGHATPYFQEKRLDLVKTLVEQRAVSHSLTGLLSASINLYPHQVEVLRRILNDSTQRYLLADQTGLGKTIEAGVILRQYLMDEPQGKAAVIVPQYLLTQWRTELESKFFLSQFGDRVKIVATSDANQITPSAALGLLIIDEAHSLAALAASPNQIQRKVFETCKYLSQKSDRLILLSSLSLSGNEKEYLVMLHLLDSETYRLHDMEVFKEAISKKEEIGTILYELKKSTEVSTIKNNLKKLSNLSPEDKYLSNALNNVIDSPDSQGELEKITNNIVTHVRDTYSLDSRILRNPRSSAEDIIYDRNITPKVEYELDERSFDIHEILESWRTSAPKNQEYQRIFLLFFQGGGTWLGILKLLLESRLNHKSDSRLLQEFNTEDIELLTQTPFFTGEEKILQSLLSILKQPSEDGDRIELLKIVLLYHFADRFGLQSFRSNIEKLQERVKSRIERPFSGDTLPKIIIFTSFIQTSNELVSSLQGNFGKQAVVFHQSGKTRDEIEKNLSQFKTDPNCFILICDSSAIEGHNLQFVNWIINFDLPWSPMILEKRIGRFDRMGRPVNIDFTLFAGAEVDDSPHDAWYQILKDGFGVFQKSITNLESYFQEKLPKLEAILFQSGGKGLVEEMSKIKEEIVEAQEKIDQQNVLDEIDISDERATEYFETLFKYDSQYQKIQRAVEGWMCQALRFKDASDVNKNGVSRYQPITRTMVPADHVKSIFVKHLEASGTYKREVASQYAGVKLYRIGEGLLQALSNYIRWDDRGQAFAMWRCDQSWDAKPGKEWVGFRFNYIVEANITPGRQLLQKNACTKADLAAFERRADALFPPMMETIFVDGNMKIVEDESLIAILQSPYYRKNERSYRDYNLAKNRLVVLDEFIKPEQWEKFCRLGRSKSEELLQKRSDFVEKRKLRLSLAETKLQHHLDQLAYRAAFFSNMDNSALLEEIAEETPLIEALLQGIRQPRFKLDSLGFIVVSGRSPLYGDDDD
jgi:ATP-dependent helicase HepA